MEETSFENKCDILADLWTEYREDVEFDDFMAYNDLGLPLAYAIAYKIVEPTDTAKRYVNEAFALFLELLGITDNGFDNLQEVFVFTDNLSSFKDDTPE